MRDEGRCPCHELEFCPDERGELKGEIIRLSSQLNEEIRLNCLGGERELKLITENKQLVERVEECERKLSAQASAHGLYVTQTLEPKIDELHAENARLRKALEFYANEAQTDQENGNIFYAEHPPGRRAKEALHIKCSCGHLVHLHRRRGAGCPECRCSKSEESAGEKE